MSKIIYVVLALSAILLLSQTTGAPLCKNQELKDSVLAVCGKCGKPNCGGHRV